MDVSGQSIAIPESMYRSRPVISGLEMVRILIGLRTNQLDQLNKLSALEEPVVTLKIPFKTFHFIFSSDLAQKILNEYATDFTKSANYKVIEPLLGKGLVTSDGELWAKQRKIINPFFTMKQYKLYTGSFKKHCQDLASDLKPHSGRDVDVSPFLINTTFKVLGTVLFGMDFGQYTAPLRSDLPGYLDYLMKRVFIKVPDWLPMPGHTKAKISLDRINKIVDEVIRKEKAHPDPESRNSFISVLIKAQRDHEHLTDKLIRDEVKTMMLAGHETSSNTLGWAMWSLSERPDIQDKAFEEIQKFGDDPEFDQLKHMEYLRRIIMESMRLHPPAYMFSRSPKEPIEINGLEIKPGDIVATPVWSIHRDPKIWDKPDKFDPDRFKKENFGIRQKKAYLPFGAGPRRCIGSEFGLLETTAILCKLLGKFSFSRTGGFEPAYNPAITLNSSNGIRLHLESRNN